MPIKNEREYRNLETALCVEKKDDGEEERNYRVVGYATTFEPYVLFTEDGIDYKEVIDRNAFVGCDMSDVIFQFNHKGRVFARTRNNTLDLTVDETGLRCDVDLSSTESSRSIYEDIETGLVDKMSFGFIVEKDDYDINTHTRRILKFKKIFDVSCVDFPANPGTEIFASTRSLFDGWIEKEAEEFRRLEDEKIEKEKQKQRIRILTLCE